MRYTPASLIASSKRVAPLACLLITCVLGQSAWAQSTLNGAFRVVSADLGEFSTGEALQMHPDLRAQLAELDRVVLTGVPVGNKRAFDLELRRSNVLAPGAVLALNHDEQLAPSTADIFTGSVQGVPGSLAVVGISDHFTYGLIQHDGGTWIISSGPVGTDGPLIVFEAAQTPEGLINWAADACTVLQIPDAQITGPTPQTHTKNDAPCRVADVAIETDREYLSALFGDDQAAATDYTFLLVAANSQIFERDLNVKLRINYLRLWSTNDPWTGGDTLEQLFQFRDAYNANPPVPEYSGAHFFSGRGLGGGVAYLSALCFPQFNYALSANLNGSFPYPLINGSGQNWDIMVTAHEWGHNFGAPHTHEQQPFSDIDTCGDNYFAGNPCDQAQLPGTIMSYCHLCGRGVADIKLEFHPQNINQWMLPFLQNDAQCDLTGDPFCDAPSCPGDLADDFGSLGADGQVSFGDFLALLGLIGPCGGGTPGCAGDLADDFGTLGADGQVSFGDFLALLGLIGPCP